MVYVVRVRRFVILPVCISVNCKNEHAYARSAIMNT